jgi:hypothetical protein
VTYLWEHHELGVDDSNDSRSTTAGTINIRDTVRLVLVLIYRIYSRNLHTFFSSLAAEKSGCVKYADFFLCVGLDLGFILV